MDNFFDNSMYLKENEALYEAVKKRKNIRRLLKHAVFALLSIWFIFSVIVLIYASKNPYFAEYFSFKVSAPIRIFLACVFGWLPFSVAEFTVVMAVPVTLFLLVRAMVLKFVYKEKGRVKNFFFGIGCTAMLMASVFINTFGVCYKRPPVTAYLGMEETEITENDVFISTCLSSEVISGLCGEFEALPSGSTVMPYDFHEMVKRIMTGYSEFLLHVPDFVSVKPVALSEPWTYTHISGMYFPFTGESNINTNYPDFVLAFTTAHEIAHQLGYAKEDEANLLAFMSLCFSHDEYLVYSAYMHAFESLLYELEPEMAGTAVLSLDRRCAKDFSAYYTHSAKYVNKTVSAVSAGVNDTYLKVNGVENGVESYGQFTKYICRYFQLVYPEYFSY